MLAPEIRTLGCRLMIHTCRLAPNSEVKVDLVCHFGVCMSTATPNVSRSTLLIWKHGVVARAYAACHQDMHACIPCKLSLFQQGKKVCRCFGMSDYHYLPADNRTDAPSSPMLCLLVVMAPVVPLLELCSADAANVVRTRLV